MKKLRAGRPVIGLNMDFDAAQGPAPSRYRVNADYVDRICEAGGLPLLIPCVNDEGFLKAYLGRVDGFLFTGGMDYPPEMYGESAHAKTKIMCSCRFSVDMFLAKEVLKTKIPVLGICAGMQLINIAYGGKLIQHLPDAEKHAQKSPGVDNTHKVEITGGKILSGIFGRPGTQITVNSSHHQAVNTDFVSKGLCVSAKTENGVIEAIEAVSDRFLLGLQWHPERIKDKSHQQKIFSAFIKAAAK